MGALHFGESREHGTNTEVCRLAAIHARKKRIGQAIDHLAAVVTFNESRNGFVVFDRARRMKEFLRHPQLRFPREQWRHARRHDLGRNQEHETVGHLDETASGQNVSLAIGIVRADQLITQAERAAEIGGPRLFADKGIWACLYDATGNVVGAEHASQARRSFIQRVFDVCSSAALLLESKCGGET